MLQNSFI